MIRLTPELTAMSGFTAAAAAAETRELDFNLARRSGIVINHIIGQLNIVPIAVSADSQIVQELDRSPDNATVWLGTPIPDDVEYDSSRVFRQAMLNYQNIVVATQGLSAYGNPILERDWSHLPMNERPISMTAMRHNVLYSGTSGGVYQALLIISYVIVELSLQEIGVLNASRR